MIPEEDTPGTVGTVETEIFDPNTIAAAAASNSAIAKTIGVYDDREATTPIFKINPTQSTP